MLTVLLLILFGIIDFGRLLFASQSMKSASREGARAAVVLTAPPAAATAAAIAADASAHAAGDSAAALAGGALQLFFATGNPPANTPLTTSTSGLCSVRGNPLTIRATSGFRWFTPVGIFASNVNSVSGTTTMRCE